MALDTLRQDLRHAVAACSAPAFTIVTILTLALGIGANTAIFSIVNGVILRPLGYPKPEQLMYLTTQFPAFGFDQFWVSPPEYLEFRELNQSFSAVGAFTTGEVNLTAGDRPLRVRSASVDDDLLNALGVQAAQGRLFAKGETDVTGPPPAPGQPPPLPPPSRSCRTSCGRPRSAGRPIVGQTVEVNGLRARSDRHHAAGRRRDGQPHRDLAAARPQSRQSPEPRQPLPLSDRPAEGRRHAAGGASRARRADRRTGASASASKNHVFVAAHDRRDATGHILQMKPVQEEIVGSASRAIWVLQAAVGFVLLIACANLANLLLARAETRHREFAVRTALGAGRGRLLRQFMTEGVLLSLVGGALGLVLARAGVQALIRAYPTSLPRTSEVTVDPLVLLFTLGVSIATGLVFGLRAADAHARQGPGHRAQGRRRERRDRRGAPSHPPRAGDGRSRAGRDARDRRGPAAAHGLQPHHASTPASIARGW